jgi:hypothetical protein
MLLMRTAEDIMKAHTIAVTIALVACGAVNTGTSLPVPPSGIEQSSVTTTSAEQTATEHAAKANAQNAGTGTATTKATRERTEDSNRTVASPPREPNAGGHGLQPPPTPRPINTGDPCGWCKE